MHIQVIQHVAYEGPAHIESWAAMRGHAMRRTCLYRGEPLPERKDFDMLVVMGGPMGVHDEKLHTWMHAEKRFIEETIAAGKAVLGVCLGAQLIADVLGAAVYKNEYREHGWHMISLTPEAKEASVCTALPDRFRAFLWHGDAFDVPQGAVRLAASAACPNQAFVYDNRVMGLQFHLEATEASLRDLFEHSGDIHERGPYIQKTDDILAHVGETRIINGLMKGILDALSEEAP